MFKLLRAIVCALIMCAAAFNEHAFAQQLNIEIVSGSGTSWVVTPSQAVASTTITALYPQPP